MKRNLLAAAGTALLVLSLLWSGHVKLTALLAQGVYSAAMVQLLALPAAVHLRLSVPRNSRLTS